ncbi:MAG: shikimate dehydrogenase [Thermodesulfobacteriota bacterium]|nr:shikimate dehydrogenase [Thermodesulfobacteriota bacterium]
MARQTSNQERVTSNRQRASRIEHPESSIQNRASSIQHRESSIMKVFCILSDERAFRLKSPDMFSTVMKRLGIKGRYVPFAVKPEDIGQAVQSIRILNMAGVNITVPYKEKVIPFLDVLSEGANIIGAVNTIVCNGDILKGYNTNAIGFMDALSDADFDVEGKTALVFGTGGAAKSVVFIFNWLRTDSIIVAGRRKEKALEIVDRFSGDAMPIFDLPDRPFSANIVVNATSVSSTDESPELAAVVEKLEIPECELVLDLNYGHTQNFWQDMAKARGIRFVDGLSTLAFQARRTFALWTGTQVPPDEFLKAIDERPSGT